MDAAVREVSCSVIGSLVLMNHAMFGCAKVPPVPTDTLTLLHLPAALVIAHTRIIDWYCMHAGAGVEGCLHPLQLQLQIQVPVPQRRGQPSSGVF